MSKKVNCDMCKKEIICWWNFDLSYISTFYHKELCDDCANKILNYIKKELKN